MGTVGENTKLQKAHDEFTKICGSWFDCQYSLFDRRPYRCSGRSDRARGRIVAGTTYVIFDSDQSVKWIFSKRLRRLAI